MNYYEAHSDKFEKCQFCCRLIKSDGMEFHHVIPQSAGGKSGPVLRACGTCHDVLHHIIPITQIHEFDTVDKVKNYPQYQIYLKWIITKKNSKIYRIADVLKKIMFFP